MRNKIIGSVIGLAALAGAFFGGMSVTSGHDAPKPKAVQSKLTEAQKVELYNDGFMDGSCQKWEDKGVDGFGNYCDTFGKENN